MPTRYDLGRRDTGTHRVRGIFTNRPAHLPYQILRALAARGFTETTDEERRRHARHPSLRPDQYTRVFRRGAGVLVSVTDRSGPFHRWPHFSVVAVIDQRRKT